MRRAGLGTVMIETSKQLSVRILAAVALALPACNPDAAGQIPCVEDVSCPNDYPVCGPAGKCIAGTSNAGASVAIVGADGHAAADFLSGTVRVLVSARASTGVKTVALSSGSVNFAASATAAAPPLYAFDANTTALADGDAPLTATLTAGDGTTGTASGTLHVDNAKPAIAVFTVAGGASGTVTSGKTIPIAATFSGGTGTLTSSAGGSLGVTSGASVLVSPDAASTFKLRVTSRSGVIVESGSTGQPPDVTVAVVAPVSFTSNFTVSPSAIAQGDAGTFTFTAPTFGASVVSATVQDGTNPPVAIASGGTVQIPYPLTLPGTTALTYNLVLKNAATSPDTVSLPVVVKVNQAAPTITSFTFQSNGTAAATFNPGDNVVLAHTYDAKGGTARINAVIVPGPSGGTTTVNNVQSSTVYRLTVTNPDGLSTSADVTATVNARINAFTVGATQPASSSGAIISSGSTTKLFASFAGSASGNAAALSCAPSCNATLGATTIASGGSVTVTPSANGTFTYTLTVTPSSGPPATATVTVKVVPLANATSLAANATVIHSGGVALLTPTFDFGTSPVVPGTATIVGTDGSTYSNLVSMTDVAVSPVATTTYTLNVSNGAGTPAVSPAPVTVTVAPGTWSPLNNSPLDVPPGATVTAVNGKVLIAGGLASGTPTNQAYLCDSSGACASKTMVGSARAYHTAVAIGGSGAHAGKLLLAGGYDTSSTHVTASAEFFDPASESFVATTNLSTARARHVAVLLGDSTTVLVVGGTDGTNDLKTAMKYKAGGNLAPTVAASGDLVLTLGRADFTGTLLGSGKVLIVGGKAGNLTAELYDPAGSGNVGTFGATAGSLPTGEDKRSHTAVLLNHLNLSGKVLISGGNTTAGRSATQFLYDPVGDSFVAVEPLATARSNQAAIEVSTRSVLICGGTTNGSDVIASCERYDPASGTGTMFPTAPMLEPRTDFGMAQIPMPPSPSLLFGIVAAGGTVLTPFRAFAETYDTN